MKFNMSINCAITIADLNVPNKHGVNRSLGKLECGANAAIGFECSEGEIGSIMSTMGTDGLMELIRSSIKSGADQAEQQIKSQAEKQIEEAKSQRQDKVFGADGEYIVCADGSTWWNQRGIFQMEDEGRKLDVDLVGAPSKEFIKADGIRWYSNEYHQYLIDSILEKKNAESKK